MAGLRNIMVLPGKTQNKSKRAYHIMYVENFLTDME